MTRNNRILTPVALTLLIALVVSGCSSRHSVQSSAQNTGAPSSSTSSVQPRNGLLQSSEGGSVTVDVEWSGIRGNSLSFRVAMNTHSVNLDQYDLSKLARLRDDAGNEFPATAWSSAPGGHHRQGNLTFPLPDSLSTGKTKYLQLIISDIAGVEERVLKWKL